MHQWEVAVADAGVVPAQAITHYRSVTVDGIDVAYREAGPEGAPVLVLLHGFPTSSRMFRNLIPRLSDAYRVIAPDYPGFGHSAVPERTRFGYTFDHLAEVIDKLLDLLYDIRTNAPTFQAMQEFIRDRKPPTLVATGRNDEIFPEEVQRQILTDHPTAEYHALDTGHFALEDKADQIAGLIRDFLHRTLPRA